MAKIDFTVVERIHNSLKEHVLQYYQRYYYLAYSLVKNQEGAKR